MNRDGLNLAERKTSLGTEIACTKYLGGIWYSYGRNKSQNIKTHNDAICAQLEQSLKAIRLLPAPKSTAEERESAVISTYY